MLQIYTAYDATEVKIFMEAFRRETKINVEWTKLPAGDILSRLTAESKSPKATVWFGGPNLDFIAARKAGLLTPYHSRAGNFLKVGQRDPNWYWTGMDFGAIAFVSNVNEFQKRGLAYPTSWQDLLKPEYKNTIALSYPYTSGTAYVILGALVALYGEDGALEYWKKLDLNANIYNKSGASCVVQVGLGEVPLGIAFSSDIMAKGFASAYPIKMTFPKEGTGYQIGCVGLIKGSPGQKNGKRFIDWVLSKSAQDLFKVSYRSPLNPAAEVNSGTVRPGDVKLAKGFNAEWMGINKDRLILKWREAIGK